MNEKRSYYAIIPANVRYDKRLTPNAKLLYGEITALCNERGYCWAGDDYFSDLYQSSKRTVQTWLKSLEDNGYINREVIFKEGTKQIEKRIIKLGPSRDFVTYSKKMLNPIEENCVTPIEENCVDNNTYINNTINNNHHKNGREDCESKTTAIDLYQKIFGFPNMIVMTDIQEAVKEMGNELVSLAIEETARREVKGKGSWKYAEAILDNWRKFGVKTVEEAKRQIDDHDKQQNNRKEKYPQPKNDSQAKTSVNDLLKTDAEARRLFEAMNS